MIRLDDVEKTYRTRRGELVHAVEDVSVSIRENEFVTFVGRSESTLITAGKFVHASLLRFANGWADGSVSR